MPKEYKTNYGPSGPATVTVTPKVITVKLDSDKYLEPFRFERSAYKGVVVAGRCQARISADTQTLYGLRPLTGNFFVRFSEFSHKRDANGNDEAPMPRKVPARTGRKGDGTSFPVEEHLEFTALCTVTQGTWEGATIPINLWYHFDEYQSTGLTSQIIGKSKSKILLDNFLIHAGVDMEEEAIPWSENILPDLEEKLQAAGKEFLLNLNAKGYPDTISAAPDAGSKPAKKKKAKK